MLSYCLIVVLGLTFHARAKIHFAHGVLVEEDCPVWISSDKVTMSVQFENLALARLELKVASSKVWRIRKTLDDIQTTRNISEPQVRSLTELRVSVKRVFGLIEETMTWLPEYRPNKSSISSTRKKRAAVVILASAAIAAIAEVSMASLVTVENLRTNLQEHGRVLQSLQGKDEKLEKDFHDLRASCNVLFVTVNEIKKELDVSNVLFSLQVALWNIEKETESLMSEIKSQIDAVIAASRRKLSEEVLPLSVLESVMKDASYDWGANLIFTRDDLYKYYGVLRVRLSARGLIMEIPISTMKSFNSYIIRPFPNTYGNSVVVWPGMETLCIIGDLFQSCAIDYEIGCTFLDDRYLCDSEIFELRTIDLVGCEIELIRGLKLTDCTFEKFIEAHHVRTTKTSTAVFCSVCGLAVRCGEANETHSVPHGVHIFDRSCRIVAEQFKILRRKIFNTDTKVYMRHLQEDHNIVTLPPTSEAVTVPELPEDNDEIIIFVEKYSIPFISVVLVIIAFLVCVMVIIKTLLCW